MHVYVKSWRGYPVVFAHFDRPSKTRDALGCRTGIIQIIVKVSIQPVGFLDNINCWNPLIKNAIYLPCIKLRLRVFFAVKVGDFEPFCKHGREKKKWELVTGSDVYPGTRENAKYISKISKWFEARKLANRAEFFLKKLSKFIESTLKYRSTCHQLPLPSMIVKTTLI